jgi:hypothetical protein
MTLLDGSPETARWGFLTNHAHVLVCVAHDPGIRVRDIAAAVGITERAAHGALSQLVEAGYLLREREGRRNRYTVVAGRPLRHPSSSSARSATCSRFWSARRLRACEPESRSRSCGGPPRLAPQRRLPGSAAASGYGVRGCGCRSTGRAGAGAPSRARSLAGCSTWRRWDEEGLEFPGAWWHRHDEYEDAAAGETG